MGKPVEFQQFGGLIPKQNPALLPIRNPVVARDAIMWHGDLRPIAASVQVAVSGRVGVIRTIYRMGIELAGDANYWLSWLDDVDVARGAIAGDTTERTYFAGVSGKPPQVTNLQMASTGGGTSMPNASYDLGVMAPTGAPGVADGGTGSSTITETRVYVYTYVSVFGEEGPPSPASAFITVPEDGSVNVTNLLVPPGGNYNYVSKRIYRSVLTSSGQGVFEFVDEVSMATTSYNDVKQSQDLGEVITTTTYFPPPSDLRGLVDMPNGIMVGFSGYGVWFCEPYLPYAWPTGYQQTVNFPVVGLGVFDQSVVVLTTGTPWIITGVDPTSMSVAKADFNQSCASKRSIVMTDLGVIWASPDGLCYIGSDGSKVLTQDLYTREDWVAKINPSTITAAWYDGHYIFTCSSGTYCFTPGTMELTQLSDVPTAMYTDPVSDQLYFCIGNSIQRFNAGAPKTFTWQTKPVSLLSTIAPSCARVDADAYPSTVTVLADKGDGNGLQPLPTILGRDGVTVIHPVTVNDERPFRLPSGFRPQQFALSVASQKTVRYFAWANDPKDLAID